MPFQPGTHDIMSDLQSVTTTLEQAARRLRCQQALRGLWLGLLVGAALWLAALAAHKLLPLPESWLRWAGGVAASAPLVGAVLGGWRKPSLATTARWVDVQSNLQERLSTALEVARTPADPRWRELVVHDAATHAREVDPRRLVPLHLTRPAYWSALALALALALGFVPAYRTGAHKQRAAEKETLRDVGRGLAELTRHELAARPPAVEPARQALEQVAALADTFQKAELTRAGALKELASVQDKLKEQLRELGRDPAMKRLDQGLRAAGPGQPSGRELQQQLAALQQQLGGREPDPARTDSLKQKMEKLQDAARALPDKNHPAAAAARQELSQSLSSLAQAAAEMGLELPSLDDAIAALAANDVDKLLQNLDTALADLDKLNQLAKQAQSLSQQLAKLGRNLAEQLEQGQADLAVQTLERMIRQLQSGTLSREDLQKLLEEVSTAIDPASPYGQCAQHLRGAARHLKAGDPANAAQSLAAAAKELEDLLEQFGNCQSLAATLDALKDAARCVGSGQRWGLCRKPGPGKGNRPGPGVGTWADDDAGALGEIPMSDELVDNSGVQRPDYDPRGLTDRDAALNEALTPTRVRGQFSPGDRMPAITLPGVSIKGTSRVQLEEAATAAQTDAAAALNQDRVPRHYQGPVRDYFDDLKR